MSVCENGRKSERVASKLSGTRRRSALLEPEHGVISRDHGSVCRSSQIYRLFFLSLTRTANEPLGNARVGGWGFFGGGCVCGLAGRRPLIEGPY